MRYHVPRRYRELLLKPFSPRTIEGVSEFSLQVDAGQSIAVLGKNGAGKTTLLRLIGGLLYPTTGRVVIDGYDTSTQNSRARQAVSYALSEERSFYWRLTGRENLNFFGCLDDLIGRDRARRIENALERVGLNSAADTCVAHYSAGMRQRLAIARGILCSPRILILDEPTRALDSVGTPAIHALLNELKRNEHTSLIIATHRLGEAEQLCDKICLIDHGRMVAFKRLTEIRQEFGSLLRYCRTFSDDWCTGNEG